MVKRVISVIGAVVSLGLAILFGGTHLSSLLGETSSAPRAGSGSGARYGSGRFFDAVAPSYDRLNRIISLGLDQSWRRSAARAAANISRNAAPSGQRAALDVAAGTGDLSVLLLESSAFDTVAALDPSEEMLIRLRAKPRARRLQVVAGVAERLPWANDTFDAVTVAFGVRNFKDRTKGLREIVRVLKPDGRLVVLEASMPAGNGILETAGRFFIQEVMPLLGMIVSGNKDAYQYLSDSMAKFPDPSRFKAMLEDAGLELLSHARLFPPRLGPDMYVALKMSHGAEELPRTL